SEYSGKELNYLDPETNEKYIPYCIEPSVGVERLFLMLCCEAYAKEMVGEGDERIVMHFHPAIAPVKACICPLSKKLSEPATALFNDLCQEFHCEYDEAGSIGKRYRRNDAIGTPFCITYDFDTENDHCVTIRLRDSMEQIRLPIDEVKDYIKKAIEF
ncbi:MAG: His/Gly/Thr/Pro-type tRNA ligase C-terminal domain-containing protein, partial [Erysipelotrichaceae bacterium]|nr:His/Gly/Thr/Pro-type tRNA ligase C-terminal domain-containing protein [Erysipelotrichaceae bacterium]